MFTHIGKDAPASLVVFLVALPLCLGIALASGAEPIAGLIAGIIGGLIVAPISGSHVGVSGPAAGLAVIVYDGIQEVGFEAFLLALVIGGLAQLVLGIKLEQKNTADKNKNMHTATSLLYQLERTSVANDSESKC